MNNRSLQFEYSWYIWYDHYDVILYINAFAANDLLSGSDDGDPSSCSEKHLQSCLNGSDNPEKVMMKWRNEITKFAVTGRSGMGKSTFINLVRDVYPQDPDFAEVGFGDCTMIQMEYMHPWNKYITFTDLPGFGTDTVTKDQFSESIDLSVFDFVLIFIDSVIKMMYGL